MTARRESDTTRAFVSTISLTVDSGLAVESPMVALALDCWHRLRGSRTMPAPADVDALILPPRLLPHLLLIDLEYSPAFRLRWRLIGTHITRVVDRDMTGRYWDEIYHDRASRPSPSVRCGCWSTGGRSGCSAPPTTRPRTSSVRIASTCRCPATAPL